MRALVLFLWLVMLAGCGRFGFGESSGDDNPVDARPDASGDCGAHDEDGDGTADDCDLCPNLADDQRDTDGDGVGDACDPSNAVAHRIVLFESFVAPVPWTTTGAAQWSISDDGLHSMYTDISASSYVAPAMIDPPLALTIRYTIDGFDGSGTTNFTISAVDAFDIPSEDSQKCGQASPARNTIGHEMAGTTVDASSVQFDDSLMAGATYVTTFEHTLANMTCTTEVPAVGPSATVSVQHAPWRNTGQVGVRIRSIAATFHSLLVVVPQ